MLNKLSLILLVLFLMPASLAAQDDPCSREGVMAGFVEAANADSVETWALGYLSSSCPANIKDAAQLLADAYSMMESSPRSTSDIPFAGDYTIIKMRNALGIESEVQVSFAGAAAETYPLLSYRGIPVEIAPGIYITTPISSFRSIHTEGDYQVVTFADGQTVTGHVEAQITDPNATVYDLSTATEAELVSLAISYQTTPAAEPADETWQVHITEPVDLTFTGAHPRFTFRYYSSAGYLIGGSYRNGEADQFYANLNGQDILVRVEDFSEITFPGGTTPQHISLIVPGGEPSEVDFRVEYTDSAGGHDGQAIHLVLDIANSDRSLIIPITDTVRMTLTKIAD